MNILISWAWVLGIWTLSLFLESITSFPDILFGFFLIFFLLWARILKEHTLEPLSQLYNQILPLFFIPGGIKIAQYFSMLIDIWWKYILLLVLSSVATFVVTSLSLKWMIQRKGHFGKQADILENKKTDSH